MEVLITKSEWDKIYDINSNFYIEFSKLVNKTLSKVPEHCRTQLEMILSETANVYSRDEKLR